MNVQRIHLEKNGDVRDHAGARIGSHDPADHEKHLRMLRSYVGDLSRGRSLSADAPVTMALPTGGGELNPRDAQTAGTITTAIGGALEGVADLASPVKRVNKSFGSAMYEAVAADMALPPAPQQGGTAEPPTINPKISSVTIDATGDQALAVVMDDYVFQSSDIPMMKLGVRRLVNAFKLCREIRIQKMLTTASLWHASNVVAATVKWNGTSPTPLADVFSALAASRLPPTHIIFSEAAEQYFRTDPKVVAFYQGGGTLPITIARMRMGATTNYVWGSTACSAVLVHTPTDPDAVGTARTYRYVPAAADGSESDGYLLRTFIDERQGPGRGLRNLVLIGTDDDHILDGQVGALITGVVA